MKILVVEDAPSDLKLLRVVLASEGHHVAEAPTAELALATIHEDPPELILADLKLPGINGLDLTRQLKQDPATSGIPIIAVTSYPDDWTQQEMLDAGCEACITKPIDVRRLVQQIADIASERREGV
jgi:two-component system cell cycle response regulator DivK